MALILIVEDDDALSSLLKLILEGAGHQVELAVSGREAMKIIRLTRPDVVLTDIVMPEQDGLEVIIMLQNENPGIPVIAMSGAVRNSALYLNLSKKLGARRVLSKPFTSEQVLAVLKDVLGTG